MKTFVCDEDRVKTVEDWRTIPYPLPENAPIWDKDAEMAFHKRHAVRVIADFLIAQGAVKFTEMLGEDGMHLNASLQIVMPEK